VALALDSDLGFDWKVSFFTKGAFAEFVKKVRTERRWIFDAKEVAFLNGLRTTLTSHSGLLKANIYLWRAQSGSLLEEGEDSSVSGEHPLAEDRMIPIAKHIKRGGRANPPGFPYLYLATTKETALAEMRPWMKEPLTLGTFRLKRDCKVVVCHQRPADVDLVVSDSLSEDQLTDYVWNQIGDAFARPVGQQDRDVDYVPTQIMAELFKSEGYDGVVYKSGLERGMNVVLFDSALAELEARFLFEVNRIRYDLTAIDQYLIYQPNAASPYADRIATDSMVA
jgi:RES domain-containing protein